MTAASGSEAIANARRHTTYEPGYCQRFTREAWEVGSLYGSAQEAWDGARHKHPGDRTPPLGAPCYYRGGSKGYGHAVVFAETQIRSTDCKSTGHVSEVDIAWIEQNWGFTYLGWTGDINGVDLPVGAEGDDMPLSEDDLQKIAKRLNHALGDYRADGKSPDNDDVADDPELADQRLRAIEHKVDRIIRALDA